MTTGVPYSIERRTGDFLFECDWMIEPNGDRVKMHLPGPPGESEEEAKARGLAKVARRLRELAGDYDRAARYLSDPAYRAYRDARVEAFILDNIESEIKDGMRDEITGELF